MLFIRNATPHQATNKQTSGGTRAEQHATAEVTRSPISTPGPSQARTHARRAATRIPVPSAVRPIGHSVAKCLSCKAFDNAKPITIQQRACEQTSAVNFCFVEESASRHEKRRHAQRLVVWLLRVFSSSSLLLLLFCYVRMECLRTEEEEQNSLTTDRRPERDIELRSSQPANQASHPAVAVGGFVLARMCNFGN